MGKVSVWTHRGRSIICDEVARSQSLHKSGYAKAALYFVLPIEKEDCEMGKEAAHRRRSHNTNSCSEVARSQSLQERSASNLASKCCAMVDACKM